MASTSRPAGLRRRLDSATTAARKSVRLLSKRSPTSSISRWLRRGLRRSTLVRRRLVSDSSGRMGGLKAMTSKVPSHLVEQVGDIHGHWQTVGLRVRSRASSHCAWADVDRIHLPAALGQIQADIPGARAQVQGVTWRRAAAATSANTRVSSRTPQTPTWSRMTSSGSAGLLVGHGCFLLVRCLENHC